MHILSVNLSPVRSVRLEDGREHRTGILKRPVEGRVAVGLLGLVGDEVGNPKHHGGPDQAVYLYGADDYAWWSAGLGRGLEPGTFGENLTLPGLGEARLGDRYRVGTALLEVTAPRVPCSTLAGRMGEAGFVKRFAEAGRPGAYARVLEPGEVAAGDEARLIPAPPEHPTILEVLRLYVGSPPERNDRAVVERALACPALASRARADLERQRSRPAG